jgi:hypothetical protein
MVETAIFVLEGICCGVVVLVDDDARVAILVDSGCKLGVSVSITSSVAVADSSSCTAVGATSLETTSCGVLLSASRELRFVFLLLVVVIANVYVPSDVISLLTSNSTH